MMMVMMVMMVMMMLMMMMMTMSAIEQDIYTSLSQRPAKQFLVTTDQSMSWLQKFMSRG